MNKKMKIIYLRTQKTASSTILHTLKEYGNFLTLHPEQVLNPPKKGSSEVELAIKCFLNYLKKNNLKREDVFLITSVRNPYTKIVSRYEHRTSEGKLTKINFDEYVKKALSNNIDIPSWYHKEPTYKHMVNVDNKYEPDFTIRFETLQEDLNIIKDMFGIVTEDFHIRKGVVNSDKYLSYYKNQHTVDIINEYFRDDFENYSYEYLKL